MKKLFSLTLIFIFALTGMYAQDVAKEAKSVQKLIRSFNVSKDQAKLEKAEMAITELFKNDAANSNFDALLAKGDYHNALAGIDTDGVLTSQISGETYTPKYSGNAAIAFEAYKMALPLAEKAAQKKLVFNGLDLVDNALAQDVNFAFDSRDYELAYTAAKAILASHELLTSNGKSSMIADKDGLDQWRLYTGLAVLNSGNMPAAKEIMQGLADEGYQDAGVYETLFNAYIEEGNEEKAFSALKKGREIDPTNSGLLFAEINYLIKKEDYGRLETLLKEAIAQEPDNPSVYSTLGTVYNQLYKASLEEGGDASKSEEYFNSSKSYYTQATTIDANYFSAHYSMGELYYNKAAGVIGEMQKLDGDYSKEGMAKYDAKKKQMEAYFLEALPHFKKAEQIDPSHMNTMIAMKEIFARTGDLETSDKFKARIEGLQAGKKYDKPFFN